MKLLIIDDSPEVRAVLAEIARQYRHQVVAEAENGKQGLTLLADANPEMVLLDVSMPVMGGFATARELQRIAPEIPILFVTQHVDTDYVSEAFALGARGYVLKSAIVSELNPAIETIKGGGVYRSSQLGDGKGE